MTTQRKPTFDDVSFVRETLPTGMSVLTQVQMSGLTHSQIVLLRRKIRREMRIPVRQYRRWDTVCLNQLAELIRHGFSPSKIAQRMDRSPRSISFGIGMLGGMDTVRMGDASQARLMAVRTKVQVARLMGVSRRIVDAWIAAKVLTYQRRSYLERRSGDRRRFRYRITDYELMLFMGKRDWWMTWTADQITDEDWQAYGEECQQSVGNHWIAVTDLAISRGYAAYTGKRWVEMGILPAKKVLGRWWVWSETVTDWIPPAERNHA